jgi:hypothetical protein
MPGGGAPRLEAAVGDGHAVDAEADHRGFEGYQVGFQLVRIAAARANRGRYPLQQRLGVGSRDKTGQLAATVSMAQPLEAFRRTHSISARSKQQEYYL